MPSPQLSLLCFNGGRIIRVATRTISKCAIPMLKKNLSPFVILLSCLAALSSLTHADVPAPVAAQPSACQPDASENIRRIFNNELLDLSCRFGYPKMLS